MMFRTAKPCEAVVVRAEETTNVNVPVPTGRDCGDRSIQLLQRNIESIIFDVLAGLFDRVEENRDLAKVAVVPRSVRCISKNGQGCR